MELGQTYSLYTCTSLVSIRIPNFIGSSRILHNDRIGRSSRHRRPIDLEIATVIDPTERVTRGFCRSRDDSTVAEHWDSTTCVAIGRYGAGRVRGAGVENPCERRCAIFADICELTILRSAKFDLRPLTSVSISTSQIFRASFSISNPERDCAELGNWTAMEHGLLLHSRKSRASREAGIEIVSQERIECVADAECIELSIRIFLHPTPIRVHSIKVPLHSNIAVFGES